MEESQVVDLELEAKWEKVKSIVNGRDITIDIGYTLAWVSIGQTLFGAFDWPMDTLDFVINNEEFLKLVSPKTYTDAVGDEDDLSPDANETDKTRLAFLAGWKYGQYYRDLGVKEYCFKKFLELLNKKIRKKKTNGRQH